MPLHVANSMFALYLSWRRVGPGRRSRMLAAFVVVFHVPRPAPVCVRAGVCVLPLAHTSGGDSTGTQAVHDAGLECHTLRKYRVECIRTRTQSVCIRGVLQT